MHERPGKGVDGAGPGGLTGSRGGRDWLVLDGRQSAHHSKGDVLYSLAGFGSIGVCHRITRFTRLISDIMAPDTALELSIEQLIGALNEKLFMECERVQAAMPPVSRALVAKLSAKVQYRGLKVNLRH